MDAVHTYAAGDEVASADLNNIQAQAASLYQVAWGWRGRRPTLVCDGANVTVGAHGGAIVGTSQSTAALLPAAGSTNVTLGTPANNTWYYVYAYNSGTYAAPAITYEKSTTAPDTTRSYKTGAATHIYVGCFRTDGAGAPFAYHMVDGHYVYRWSVETLAAAWLLLLSGTETGPTYEDVDCSGFVPPTARIADIRFDMDGSSYGEKVSLRTTNDTSGASLELTGPMGTARLVLDSAQQFGYIIDAGITSVSFFALGFIE